jgi:TatD DNase family protein
MWIDSHCHLNHERFDGADPFTVADEAVADATDAMVSICCHISDEFPSLLKIAQGHDKIWCTIGTHPHNAGDEAERAVTLEELIEKANSDPNIVGIGESGLDYYYDYAPRDQQAEAFRKHIRACIETDLPLVVHARDADDDIAQILLEEGKGTPLKGVLHSFSSGRALFETGLDLGFYISFSGMVTFKNAQEIRDVALDTPADKILVETDAPFLAPTPHRGKMNTPAYVKHTGEFLAELRSVDVQEFAKQTTDNFFTLFNRAKR